VVFAINPPKVRNQKWKEPFMTEAVEYQVPRTTNAQRVLTLFAVILPFLGLIAAMYYAWGWGFTWVELALLVAMYIATGMGVTVGFHRLFAHRSYEAVKPVQFILAVLGSMSVQGPLLKWVAVHRQHHQHSDHAGDPHSPHSHGSGFWGVLAGWWHSHIGWMFGSDHPQLGRFIRDLQKERLLRFVSRNFHIWVAIGILIPTVLGGLLTGTWTGVLLGFLWGGLVRIFLVHHVTWSINSVCHLWGQRRFASDDESRNNFVCGVLAFGEGWHNNHHAFPGSARQGLRWWELDTSYIAIRAMEWFGLVWRVNVPAKEAVNARRTKFKEERELVGSSAS